MNTSNIQTFLAMGINQSSPAIEGIEAADDVLANTQVLLSRYDKFRSEIVMAKDVL